MLLKFLILINLNFIFISAQLSVPRCSFAIENEIYVCNLQIQNNEITADFSVIEGVHLQGLFFEKSFRFNK
jgi:hypothetical protein